MLTGPSTPSWSSASPRRSARSGSGETSAASRPGTSRPSGAGWKPARLPAPTRPSIGGVAWPFVDLRIRSGPVLLRGLTDADLPALLTALPDDLDMDPRNEVLRSLSPDQDRRRQLAAEIWKHRGTWSPDS